MFGSYTIPGWLINEDELLMFADRLVEVAKDLNRPLSSDEATLVSQLRQDWHNRTNGVVRLTDEGFTVVKPDRNDN